MVDSEEEQQTFPGYPPGFIPFEKRYGQWDDLVPIPQYEEGLAPICAIHYSKDYEEVNDYFRAILKKQEVSERAYHLTTEVITFSEGNYTAWFYRRKCIEELGMSL